MKVVHEHKHEYDSPDICNVRITVHAAKTSFMKHAADISPIRFDRPDYVLGMKAAHEHKYKCDSLDISDVGNAVHAAKIDFMKHAAAILLSDKGGS